MRWPWVSRLAYEAVADERDRLRAVVDRLTDDLVRLARKEHALPERRPEQRPANRPKPLPTELRNLISGFGSPVVQAQMEHEVRNAIRGGANAEDLAAKIRADLGVLDA